MKIETVSANPAGAFDVVFNDGTEQNVSLEDNSQSSGLLSAWLKTNTPAAHVPSLEDAKTKLAAKIVGQMNAMGLALVARYPDVEQRGWPIKIVEAQSVVDGSLDAGDAVQLGIEAAIAGGTVAELAAATVAAATLTGMIPSITAGLRRKLESAIEAAADEAALEAITANADQMRTAIAAAFASGDPANVQAVLAAL